MGIVRILLVVLFCTATVTAAAAEARSVVGYRRGRPTRIKVVMMDLAEVEVRTARAFGVMRDAAAKAGVELWIVSGFRSQERQRWLYQLWRAGWGNRAARPGHSNHQSGRALDLDLYRPGALAWLDANGKRFGFRRTVKGEPWHWEYVSRPRSRARRSRTISLRP